jgi:hypothetical protein
MNGMTACTQGIATWTSGIATPSFATNPAPFGECIDYALRRVHEMASTFVKQEERIRLQ